MRVFLSERCQLQNVCFSGWLSTSLQVRRSRLFFASCIPWFNDAENRTSKPSNWISADNRGFQVLLNFVRIWDHCYVPAFVSADVTPAGTCTAVCHKSSTAKAPATTLFWWWWSCFLDRIHILVWQRCTSQLGPCAETQALSHCQLLYQFCLITDIYSVI